MKGFKGRFKKMKEKTVRGKPELNRSVSTSPAFPATPPPKDPDQTKSAAPSNMLRTHSESSLPKSSGEAPKLTHVVADRPAGPQARRPPSRKKRRVDPLVQATLARSTESPAAAMLTTRKTSVSASGGIIDLGNNKLLIRVFLDNNTMKTVPIVLPCGPDSIIDFMKKKLKHIDTSGYGLYEYCGDDELRILESAVSIGDVLREWPDGETLFRLVYKLQPPEVTLDQILQDFPDPPSDGSDEDQSDDEEIVPEETSVNVENVQETLPEKTVAVPVAENPQPPLSKQTSQLNITKSPAIQPSLGDSSIVQLPSLQVPSGLQMPSLQMPPLHMPQLQLPNDTPAQEDLTDILVGEIDDYEPEDNIENSPRQENPVEKVVEKPVEQFLEKSAGQPAEDDQNEDKSWLQTPADAWTPSQIGQWLDLKNFGNYKDVFAKFNGQAFLRLKEHHFEKLMGDMADSILLFTEVSLLTNGTATKEGKQQQPQPQQQKPLQKPQTNTKPTTAPEQKEIWRLSNPPTQSQTSATQARIARAETDNVQKQQLENVQALPALQIPGITTSPAPNQKLNLPALHVPGAKTTQLPPLNMPNQSQSNTQPKKQIPKPAAQSPKPKPVAPQKEDKPKLGPPKDANLPPPQDMALPAPQDMALPAPQDMDLPAPQDMALPVPQDMALPPPKGMDLPPPQDMDLPPPQNMALPPQKKVQPPRVSRPTRSRTPRGRARPPGRGEMNRAMRGTSPRGRGASSGGRPQPPKGMNIPAGRTSSGGVITRGGGRPKPPSSMVIPMGRSSDGAVLRGRARPPGRGGSASARGARPPPSRPDRPARRGKKRAPQPSLRKSKKKVVPVAEGGERTLSVPLFDVSASPAGEEVVRVHFVDGTFRSFVLGSKETTRDLHAKICHKFGDQDFSDHALFHVRGGRQRKLDPNELLRALFVSFETESDRVEFKNAKDNVEEQVLRIFFKDGTFKSFKVSGFDTAVDVARKVATKTNTPLRGYALWELRNGVPNRIAARNLILDVFASWNESEDNQFVFSNETPSITDSAKRQAMDVAQAQHLEQSGDSRMKRSGVPSFAPSLSSVSGGQAASDMARLIVASRGGPRGRFPARGQSPRGQSPRGQSPRGRSPRGRGPSRGRPPTRGASPSRGAPAIRGGSPSRGRSPSRGASRGTPLNRGGAPSRGRPSRPPSQAKPQRRPLGRHQKSMRVRAFTNWMDYHLAKRDYFLQNLETDLTDGVLLVNLLELLSGKKLGQLNDNVDMTLNQRMHNLQLVISFLDSINLNPGKLTAEDLLDGNVDLILSLLWPIIYSTTNGTLKTISPREAMAGLMSWMKQHSAGYEQVNISNFDESWKDGLAMCAVINKIRPDILDYQAALAQESAIAAVLDLVESEFNIPQILIADDLLTNEKPDDRAIIAYIIVLKELLLS
eukprot:TRINITY_DN7829_c0_g1_i1.p1 TRINITY_DN7829_c0_g1~~TRINITY_DN7829_c0_g1_i1.p1  ORF type:complete len:1416 (-),score=265.14 TRINITY_DN7829_c0_g1_i1:772-5019(-)